MGASCCGQATVGPIAEKYPVITVGAAEGPGDDAANEAYRYAVCETGESDLEAVKAAFEAGAFIDFANGVCLRRACQYGKIEIVKYLVENGANMDIGGGKFGEYDSALYSAMHMVQTILDDDEQAERNKALVKGSMYAIVECLIQAGCDINKMTAPTDYDRDTESALACMNRNVDQTYKCQDFRKTFGEVNQDLVKVQSYMIAYGAEAITIKIPK